MNNKYVEELLTVELGRFLALEDAIQELKDATGLILRRANA